MGSKHSFLHLFINLTHLLLWALFWFKRGDRIGKALPAENRALYVFFQWDKWKEVNREMEGTVVRGCFILLCEPTLLKEL